MALINSDVIPASATAYEIDNSLRLNDDDSADLSRTPASAGNRKTWTWSGWVKRGNLGYQGIFEAKHTKDDQTALMFESSDQLLFTDRPGDVRNIDIRTTQVFRDVGAFYHIVVVVDTTQGTSTNRVKLYVNGSQVTALSTTSYPSQNYDTAYWNNTQSHRIGYTQGNSAQYLDGYLAEVNFIDGQALTPDNFGETGDYGEWKPIKYTGTYGTNGFYLDFENSGSLGADVSGNGNNWTPTNLAATDQMLDSPTNNFATFNPLDVGTGDEVFREGNTFRRSGDSYGNFDIGKTNFIIPKTGKWYAEFCLVGQRAIDPASSYFGIMKSTALPAGDAPYPDNGYVLAKDTASNTPYKYDGITPSFATMSDSISTPVGFIAQIAFDADNNKIWFGLNGTWLESGNPSAGTNHIYTVSTAYDWVFSAGRYTNDSTRWSEVACNFGQDSSFAGNKPAQGNADGNGYGDFYYAPPTGYLALCTQNLPDPTVIPSEHFNTVLWTGDGTTSGRSITGVGFQPDFVWSKPRSLAYNHNLHDIVRGTKNRLISNATNAEDTNPAYGYPSSFDSDGFTTVAGTTNNENWNTTGATYVSWNWKANGSGVSNTDGTITSTVSANVDAGFSIVSYTGTGVAATVGHGLSQAPEMVIVKNRDVVKNWAVGHTGFLASQWMQLEATSGVTNAATVWNSTYPSASSISIGTASVTNANGENYIAYAFHSVEGYSKVGSYTGNGSTDGTFVHCGFRPAYVMIKATSISGEHWHVLDSKRDPYNVTYHRLTASASYSENTNDNWYDFTSNGYKIRWDNAGVNQSGVNYIFYAVAENPFKHTNAR